MVNKGVSRIFDLRPGDFVIMGLLVIVCFMTAVNLNRNPDLIKQLMFHIGIL